jgi:hypothetical protein
MPTGYTAAIKDGITFEKFALDCARAFGALVTMRDDPWDAPIPDRIEPSDYHQKKLEETHSEIDRVSAMSLAELADTAVADFRNELQTYQDYIAKEADLLVKYESMLEKVQEWTPPTSEHTGLKDFMLEQITSSIEFDCGSSYWYEQIAKLREQTPEEWKESRLAKLHKDLAYHEDEHRKEIERASQRTAWIRALKISLK